MAPRTQRSQVEPASSSSSADIPTLDLDTLQNCINDYTTNGPQPLTQILAGYLPNLASSALSSIPFTHALIALIQSLLASPQLVEVFSGVLAGNTEDNVVLLGESLSDVVQVLVDESEDLEQAKKGDMEGETLSPGDKGVEVIRLLMESGALPSHIPNLVLSPPTLLKLNLHPLRHQPEALQRQLIKKQTALYYKQSKFNLLRESSEGFSALIVLLTSSTALVPDTVEEADEEVRSRAGIVWSRVMGLIGYFNLSPPRVLDVVLEVASCHVGGHWRFFLELLRCSPWGKGADGADRGEGKGKGKERDEGDRIEGVLIGYGDRVLSQVVGAKFGFAQKPDGGETSQGLINFTALLVKYRFVGLADLLPFLSPDDAEMEATKIRWQGTMSQSKTRNALLDTVLVDDTAPAASTSTAQESNAPVRLQPPQKIQLLQALLSIGDMPSSLYLLNRYPWVAQSHPLIADLILAFVAHAIEKVYRRLPSKWGASGEESLDLEEPVVKVNAGNAQENSITFFRPVPPATTTRSFRYFYPFWEESLDEWETVDEILTKGRRWLSFVRGMGGRDAETIVKICRIGAAEFLALRKAKEVEMGIPHGSKSKGDLRRVEPTEKEMKPWLDLLRSCLLPALSASNITGSFDVEIWHLLKHFPYTVRFGLYGEWRDVTCGRGPKACPIAAQAANDASREVKRALQRVTAASSNAATGIVPQQDRGPARALAKLSHSNPSALWSTVIAQVKSYPNIGTFIVEAGRYMTQLSMDVAGFTLVEALTSEKRPMLNENADVSDWLANLTVFIGDLNRRYAQIELEPFLQYIMNRLTNTKADDLTLLNKLITSMTGLPIIDDAGVAKDQLRGYASGPEMLREAFYATVIGINKPNDNGTIVKAKDALGKSTKKSLPRLINALRDTQLAVPMWIALAQLSQMAVDTLPDAPIKALSLMQDSVQSTLIQYGNLLGDNLSPAEHINLIPDLGELVNDYNLDFAQAFQILRPRLNAASEKYKAEERNRVQAKLAAEKERALSSAVLDNPNGNGLNSPLGSPRSPTMVFEDLPGDSDELEGAANGGGQSIPPPKPVTHQQWTVSKSLHATMTQAARHLSKEATDLMGVPFFVNFWHLNTSDIAFSPELYKKAIAHLEGLEKEVSRWRANNESELKAERKRLKDRAEVLRKERESQDIKVNGIRRRLSRESKVWFKPSTFENQSQKRLAAILHQYCFYPRSLLSPCDAIYVAKTIRLMHDMGTPSFATFWAYAAFFGDSLAACIFSAATNEARNFGRCLAAMLTDIHAWHQDEETYQREALGLSKDGDETQSLPGMLVRYRGSANATLMTWNNYRMWCAKNHTALTNALVSCWSGSDFMHVKNGITVAIQVADHFPMIEENGKALVDALQALVDGKYGELPPDLELQCTAFHRQLSRLPRPLVTSAAFGAPTARPTLRSTSSTLAVSSPARAVPAAPRSATPLANGRDTPKAANGGTSTPPSAPAIMTSDPKLLRQKLEETRSLRNVSASLTKDEPRTTDASSKLKEEIKAEVDTAVRGTTTPVAPAGPRVTRSSTAAAPAGPSTSTPTGPANTTRIAGIATQSSADTRAVPTGPARSTTPAAAGLPNRPVQANSSMGPPASTQKTIEEDRLAARARKFGALGKATPPTGPSASIPTAAPAPVAAIKAEPSTSRPTSPAVSSRHNSPPVTATSGGRSGSVESNRSRRDRKDKDDQSRTPRRETQGDDTRSSRDKDAKKELLPSTSGDRNGSRSRGASVSKTSVEDDRKRQEDLLQARHEKLVSGDREVRRSSRDEKRKETDAERDERKALEREKDRARDRDKEREKSAKPSEDGSGGKRKRDDEPPRRIDDPKDRDRDRERSRRDDDRRRGEARRDERNDGRSDRREGRDGHDRREGRDPRRDDRRDRDDHDDRRNNRRDDREHDRRRYDRDGRDSRAPPRSPLRPRSPERRDLRPAHMAAEPMNGDKTPKRDAPKEVAARNGSNGSDRIVDVPRSSRASDTPRDLPKPAGRPEPLKGPRVPEGNGQSKQTYGLPPRPGAGNNARSGTSSLADRMGPAPSSRPSTPPANLNAPLPPVTRSRPQSPDNEKKVTFAENAPDPRKRSLDLTESTPVREDSPGASKRIKIDRDKMKRAGPGTGGGNRLLASAITASSSKSEK